MEGKEIMVPNNAEKINIPINTLKNKIDKCKDEKK
jgi:hypothetical protein